jgi:hypothetical protein
MTTETLSQPKQRKQTPPVKQRTAPVGSALKTDAAPEKSSLSQRVLAKMLAVALPLVLWAFKTAMAYVPESVKAAVAKFVTEHRDIL